MDLSGSKDNCEVVERILGDLNEDSVNMAAHIGAYPVPLEMDPFKEELVSVELLQPCLEETS
jgi:hypothetical protein